MKKYQKIEAFEGYEPRFYLIKEITLESIQLLEYGCKEKVLMARINLQVAAYEARVGLADYNIDTIRFAKDLKIVDSAEFETLLNIKTVYNYNL